MRQTCKPRQLLVTRALPIRLDMRFDKCSEDVGSVHLILEWQVRRRLSQDRHVITRLEELEVREAWIDNCARCLPSPIYLALGKMQLG